MALFITSKVFSICSSSSLFIGSQGRIGSSNIEIHRVVRRASRVRRRIALRGMCRFRRVLNARCWICRRHGLSYRCGFGVRIWRARLRRSYLNLVHRGCWYWGLQREYFGIVEFFAYCFNQLLMLGFQYSLLLCQGIRKGLLYYSYLFPN